MKKKEAKKRVEKERKVLTIQELEARIAPSSPTGKKPTTPAPYPAGARYGLISRSNL